MSDFFDSDIIQEELNEINKLRRKSMVLSLDLA